MFVEYAKVSPEDILIQITVCNRGPEAATLHVLPTLWFRNTWSSRRSEPIGRCFANSRRPRRSVDRGRRIQILGTRYVYCEDAAAAVHRERNQHRTPRAAHRTARRTSRTASTTTWCTGARTPSTRRRSGRRRPRITRSQCGAGRGACHPPAADRHRARVREGDERIAASSSATVRRRAAARRREADEFYERVMPASLDDDAATSCGRRWRGCCGRSSTTTSTSSSWLQSTSRSVSRPRPRRATSGGPHVQRRHHLDAGQVGVSVVCGVGSRVSHPRADARGPRLRQASARSDAAGTYLHPNGQIPAYEWNFGDVNPPVHAWATLFTYRLEKQSRRGMGISTGWSARSRSCCSTSPGG